MANPINHDCDCAAITNVTQATGPITDVKPPPTTAPPQGGFDLSTIGGRMAWARDRLHMSQGALAKAAGVAQSTIGNVEAGLRQQPRQLNAIAKALGLRAEWLESGKGPRLVGDAYAAQDVADALIAREPEAAPYGGLLADLEDLLPEDVERFRVEIHERAEQMRRHRDYLLTKAGAKEIAGAAKAAHIPAAPPPKTQGVGEGAVENGRPRRGRAEV